MHCFVMGLLKSLAIRIVQFLALHKNPRIKADSDLISASLVGQWDGYPLAAGRYSHKG